jgi:PPOX class probable F420-dependent enzyme
MSVIPDAYRDILESTTIAHVATIGPHGEPQVNPVWFGWDGTYLRFSQTTTRQKYRNLKKNPLIAVSLIDSDNQLRYIEIRGRVVRIDDDSDFKFIDSMAKKYLGQDHYPWRQPGEVRVVVVVEPQHTTQMG